MFQFVRKLLQNLVSQAPVRVRALHTNEVEAAGTGRYRQDLNSVKLVQLLQTIGNYTRGWRPETCLVRILEALMSGQFQQIIPLIKLDLACTMLPACLLAHGNEAQSGTGLNQHLGGPNAVGLWTQAVQLRLFSRTGLRLGPQIEMPSNRESPDPDIHAAAHSHL